MNSDSYSDNNGNGIPDAFENRPSITEILNTEPQPDEWAFQSPSSNAQVRGGLLRRLIGNNSVTGSADYGKYRIHIPTEGNAVMLEIKNGESFVACVFRSDQEMRTFISHFEELRAAVFGG